MTNDATVGRVEEEHEWVDKGGHELLANPALWTALFHESSCSVCPTVEAFGDAQPPVRKAAWSLVDALLRLRTQTQGKMGMYTLTPFYPSRSLPSLTAENITTHRLHTLTPNLKPKLQ